MFNDFTETEEKGSKKEELIITNTTRIHPSPFIPESQGESSIESILMSDEKIIEITFTSPSTYAK